MSGHLLKREGVRVRVLFLTESSSLGDLVSKLLNGPGLSIDARAMPTDLPRIQADLVDQVAAWRAREAYGRFKEQGEGLMLIEQGLYVPALEGWPGPYTKAFFGRIPGGPSVIHKLLWQDGIRRSAECNLVEALAYMDERLEEPKLFLRSEQGLITDRPMGERGERREDVLDRYFVPDGYCSTVAQMGANEFETYRYSKRMTAHYREFADWITSRRCP